MYFLILFLTLFSNPRTWVIPTIYHGEVKDAVSIPDYTKDSIEFKILQLSLDIENLIRSHTMDPKYKDVYFSSLPKSKALENSCLKRNKNYLSIENLKKSMSIDEDGKGLLVSKKALNKTEAKLLEDENINRKELFLIICDILSLEKEKICPKVSEIYAQSIINFKIYALKETNTNQTIDDSFLTYMVSNYKYETVIKVLKKMLKEQKFSLDTKLDLKTNVLIPSYACLNDEFNASSKIKDYSFVVKLCTVKNNKIVNCTLNSEYFNNVAIENGTLIIVNKVKDGKTLSYSNDKTEDLEIMLCKKTKFSLIEDLSQKLLTDDKNVKK